MSRDAVIIAAYKSGLTRSAVAKALGVSDDVVANTLKRHGVAMRSRSEAQRLRQQVKREKRGTVAPEQRDELGVCGRCGAAPQEIGRKWCANCLERSRARTRERAAKYKAAGLCHCGKPPEPGKQQCAKCIEIRERSRARRRRDGLCCLCGSVAVDGITFCETHRAEHDVKSRVTYWTRVAAGLCGYCGGPRTEDAKRICADCSEKRSENNRAYQKEYYRRRRQRLKEVSK